MDRTRNELEQFYAGRAHRFEQEKIRLEIRSTWIASGRFVLFVAVVTALWCSIRFRLPLLLLPAVAALAGFLALLKTAVALRRTISFLETLVTINNEEIRAVKGDHSAFDAGTDFIDFHHDFSYDLDIFGEHSLFRMVNRTATLRGRQMLAARLMQPERDAASIRLRQEAIAELAGKTAWRQDFQATARESDRESSQEPDFSGWLNATDRFSGKLFYTAAIYLNAFITVTIALVSLLHALFPEAFPWSIPPAAYVYFLLPVALIVSRTRIINREQLKLEKLLGLFRKYSSLLKRIEEEKFETAHLQAIQKSLETRSLRSSRVLDRLAAILWGLEVRGNLIVSFFLNSFFLWDILQMIRLERWRKMYGGEMDKWIAAIGELEVLNSLATLAHNRPDLVRPEILEGTFSMNISDGGHLLIDPARRVDNSLSFTGEGRIYLITGANMAGKSTLLRMVGTNMVLAMAGAPVCARTFSMVPVAIHTSVRTNDSLGDDESYFYAELKRLSAIIRRAETGDKPFIIIDEMLKGTNSRDKHTGSAALIRRLIHLGASGLAATHDVELGELETEYPNRLLNRCFEVDTHEGQLNFDYLLRPGVSKNLNATFLMKKMGIIPETL